MFTKFRMKEEKGFTLIELLIVVAIIGILAAIAIPQFGAYRKRGYNAAANSDLRSIRTSEEAMMADYSEYGASPADGAQGGTGVAILGPTAMTLSGGRTTTASVSISLSSNVVAIAESAENAAGTPRTNFAALSGHASGDNYYATSNGTISGSSALYRKTTTAAPTTALVDANIAGFAVGASGASATMTLSGADAWIQM